jgi:uncharacterized coiled-coil protein SlyX
MILVNVASRAEELRVAAEVLGNSTDGIPESAAKFGSRIVFTDKEERSLDLPQKANKAANLFINNRELAMAACNAFIRISAVNRNGFTVGTYERALQEIIKAAEHPSEPDIRKVPTEEDQGTSEQQVFDTGIISDVVSDDVRFGPIMHGPLPTGVRLDTLERKVAKLENVVIGLNNSVTALESTVAELEKAMKGVTSGLTALKRKHGWLI